MERRRENPLLCASLVATVRQIFVLMPPVVGFILSGFQVKANETIPHFIEVTASAGIRFLHVNGTADKKDYIFEAKGGGVGFLDFDNDGWMDILLVQGSTLEMHQAGNDPGDALYRNRRDGTFVDVTKEAGLNNHGWGMGVTFADYNNDDFTDIYLTRLGPNVLYRNNGDGTLTDVTAAAGVGDPRWSTSAAFADYDRDGDLDLYVVNYLDVGPGKLPPPKSERCIHLDRPVLCGPRGLPGAPDVLYRNNGDGTFSEATKETHTEDKSRYFGLGVVWADIDNDNDPDLYVGNDATPNSLFINQGDGTFEESGYLAGLAVSGDGKEQASMGVDIADYDNDGLLDVFLTHFSNDFNTLYHNEGDLLFTQVTGHSGFQRREWVLVSWGTRFVDLNHDGWKDLFFANGHVYPFLRDADYVERYAQPKSFYLNNGDGTFRDASEEAGPDICRPTVGRGMAFADWDNDGDMDFISVNMNGSPQLFRNDLSPDHHWIIFRLKGDRSPHDGTGARVTISSDGLEQIWEVKTTVGIYSASDPRAHFGVRNATRIDRVLVRWPSGLIEEFKNVPVDSHYLIREGGELTREGFR